MAGTTVKNQVRPTAASHRRRDEIRTRGPDGEARGLRVAFERIALGALTTLISVNLWTGGPVFALWVGSRVQAAVGTLSMAAVGATVGVLMVVTFLLYRALALMNARYNTVTGRVMRRQQAVWLKPMSGERRSLEVKRPLSAVERIVVASVVVAVLTFEVWFFFFAHYRFAG
jgi:hypothetical protein